MIYESYKWSCISLVTICTVQAFLRIIYFFLLWEKILEDQQGIFTTGNSMWNDVTVHSTYLSKIRTTNIYGNSPEIALMTCTCRICRN